MAYNSGVVVLVILKSLARLVMVNRTEWSTVAGGG